MVDELLGILLLVLAFVAGFRLGARFILWKIAKFVVDRRADLPAILKELNAEIDAVEAEDRPEGLPKDSVEVTVEREGEQFYLYRKSNNQFLGQGPTLMEALNAVKKRFPDESFWGGVERELAEKWGLNKEIERQKS